MVSYMKATFIKLFKTENSAMSFMRTVNQARKAAGNRDLVVFTDGPDNNFAVVDLGTAIELGNGYKWEA